MKSQKVSAVVNGFPDEIRCPASHRVRSNRKNEKTKWSGTAVLTMTIANDSNNHTSVEDSRDVR